MSWRSKLNLGRTEHNQISVGSGQSHVSMSPYLWFAWHFCFLCMRFLCFSCRWKTHKWRRCQLVPWSVQQDSPGAQEGCGPGRQARGGRPHSPSAVELLFISSASLTSPPRWGVCCLDAMPSLQSRADTNVFTTNATWPQNVDTCFFSTVSFALWR